MGEIPLMTPQGTFVINGAERVVVSQLHRSPGIAFESTIHLNGKVLYSFRIIPDRGSWIEVQFDTADLLYIYLDRRKRRRKFLATTFLRALGYGSDEEVIKLFYHIETLKLSEKLGEEELATKVLIADVLDGEATVARAFEPLTTATVRQILALGHHDVKVIDISNDDTVVKALKKDPAHDQEEALKDIYRKLRPGDPPTVANAKALLTPLDMCSDGMSPQNVINPNALSTVIRDFLGQSQKSQFMDQTNPLAELTHKRRLSAFGLGGLSRARAGFEVRDVHPSLYG